MEGENAVRLDEQGRCPVCNEAPQVKKYTSERVCPKCQRAFDPKTGEQVASLAWDRVRDSSPPKFKHALGPKWKV